MGPDYTHWHGTYDLAKHFYSELVPELEEIITSNINSDDPDKIAQAKKLQEKPEEVLNSDDHKWFLNKQGSKE